MTVYIITPEEHAQILESFQLMCRMANIDHALNPTLATLKAMKPVEPTACKVDTESGLMVWPIEDFNDAGTYCEPDEFPIYLYAKEQQ